MFDLSNYMTAEERIELWQETYPLFRYDSQFQIVRDDKTGQTLVAFKVLLWKLNDDPHPWVSGVAAENLTTPFAFEKAETSAYARAITNTGDPKFSTTKTGKKAPRANREEMVKVAAAENDKKLVKVQADLTGDWESFLQEKPKPKNVIRGGEELIEIYGESRRPVTPLAAGVELIADGLGAVEVPQCAHGSMERKQGTNKEGKPYAGWVCPSKNRNDQCKPKWDR